MGEEAGKEAPPSFTEMALAPNLVSPTCGSLTLIATIHEVLSGGRLLVSCSECLHACQEDGERTRGQVTVTSVSPTGVVGECQRE